MITPFSLLLSALAALSSVSGRPLQKNAIESRQNGPYTLRQVGGANTKELRVYLEKDGQPISFWHDVPLRPEGAPANVVNMVVEIPRWTNSKIETNRPEALNPIWHDLKDDQPRFVQNVFPFKSYQWLYGSIPQTWESPNEPHQLTGFPGDNDPIDIIDIGQDPGFRGQVKTVKLFGGVLVLDGDETDWKLFGIDVNDPLADAINTLEDVEKYKPGLLDAAKYWWTVYKVPRGDGVIPLGFDGNWVDGNVVTQVLDHGYAYWQGLVRGEVDRNEISVNQTSTPDATVGYIAPAEAEAKLEIPHAKWAQDAEVPAWSKEWSFVKDGKVVQQTP